MMIQIAARLKPFSHLPGTACVIPLTSLQVQAFPTLLRFSDLITGKTWDEKLDWKGLVEGFTLQLDLEKKCVIIFGKTAQGFRRLWIEATQEGVQITFEKEKKQKVVAVQTIKKPEIIERLSLGKHTRLDWSSVSQRMEMEEMVPVLFLLGQLVPHAQGVSPILDLLSFNDKQKIVQQIGYFFRVGFRGILAPRLKDEEFQGIVEEGKTEGSALVLLCQGYKRVRELFFQEKEKSFSLLPNLPPQLHAGRMVSLQTHAGDLLSFEWSKKVLKRVVIKPKLTREVFLDVQKPLHSYRLNKKGREEVKKPLLLEAGKTMLLDRFEK